MNKYECAVHVQVGAELRKAQIMDKQVKELEEFCRLDYQGVFRSCLKVTQNYIRACLAEHDALSVILGEEK